MHDQLFLILGLFRTGVWGVAVAFAIREKRAVAVVAFLIATANAALNAFVTAGYLPDSAADWAPVTVSYVGSVTVSLIVLAFLLGTHKYQRSPRWTL